MGDNKDTMPMLTHHGLGFEQPKKQKEPEEEPMPPPTPQPKTTTIDSLKIEIEKLMEVQSPNIKSLIEDTECFGYGWFLPREGECLEKNCDLRSMCQLVYKRAHIEEETQRKEEEAQRKEEEEDPELKEFKELDEKHRKGKFKEIGMYERKPYVSKNRLSDRLAMMLWESLGSPPEIPDQNWIYPGPNKTEKQRNKSAREFMRQYGIGMLTSKRTNYHLYFHNGRHLLRIWVRYSTGCWTDLSSDLGMELMHHTPLKVEMDLVRAQEKPHQFFPYRTKITKKSQIKSLTEVLKAWGFTQKYGE